MDLKSIEHRITNLEKAFLQMQKNNVKVTEKADKTSTIQNEMNTLSEKTETNTLDISDTMLGLADIYTATGDNADDITDVRMAIAEIYELLDD